MSGTRRKPNNDTEFYMNRFASSAAFERGVPANLVAKRCSILNNKKERALIWYVQMMSWEPGGLEKLSRELQRGNSTIYAREKWLAEFCVNPEFDAKYSDGEETCNIPASRAAYIKQKGAVLTTALGAKMSEVLDYTAYSRGLTLMEGEARTGKSFAARAWCERQAGLARFVEVPPGNDDSGFFRALARGLGLGNFLQYKAREIRERVESVLLAHDLVLVLDEAQRLWPQRNLRYGFPGRVVWVMAMANQGVPIAMVSTPQFSEIQKAVEKNGWNAAQFTGRIKHYEPLPRELSKEDLMAVAKSVLPEADTKVLRALAIYAQNSARCLAAIDSISTRARYIAMKAGRGAATTDDVRTAMQESVIPSDARLVANLGKGRTKDLKQPDGIIPTGCNRVAERFQPCCNTDEISQRASPLAV